MVQLLDGKAMALQIKEEIANEVRSLTAEGKRAPHLAAVIVGNDGASMTYVANKEKSSREVGFTSSVYRMSETTTEKQLLEEQLAGCKDDLMFMSRYRGDNPMIDANIRHKVDQIRTLEERIRRLGDAK